MREAGAQVLVGGGRGLGSAMYEGLKTAAALPCNFIVSVDGDGQADVAELARFAFHRPDSTIGRATGSARGRA